MEGRDVVEVVFAVDEVVGFCTRDTATVEEAADAVGLFAEVVAGRMS